MFEPSHFRILSRRCFLSYSSGVSSITSRVSDSESLSAFKENYIGLSLRTFMVALMTSLSKFDRAGFLATDGLKLFMIDLSRKTVYL